LLLLLRLLRADSRKAKPPVAARPAAAPASSVGLSRTLFRARESELVLLLVALLLLLLLLLLLPVAGAAREAPSAAAAAAGTA
jgi:hypothetical protein